MASRSEFQAVADNFHAELSLAECLGSNETRAATRTTVTNLIMSTADVFAEHNSNFDRDRFYRASGLYRTESGWVSAVFYHRVNQVPGTKRGA